MTTEKSLSPETLEALKGQQEEFRQWLMGYNGCEFTGGRIQNIAAQVGKLLQSAAVVAVEGMGPALDQARKDGARTGYDNAADTIAELKAQLDQANEQASYKDVAKAWEEGAGKWEKRALESESKLAQERSKWLDMKKRMCEAAAEQKHEAVAAAYEEAAKVADQHKWHPGCIHGRVAAEDIAKAIRERAPEPQEEGPDEGGCKRCGPWACNCEHFRKLEEAKAAPEKTPFDWPDDWRPVPGTFERNCAWWLT